jgi:hypothetical protein
MTARVERRERYEATTNGSDRRVWARRMQGEVMRLRQLSALSILAAFAASIELGACANTDEGGSLPADDSRERIAADGSADGGALSPDASVDADSCVPDALCPLALFGSADGKLDLRTRIEVIRGRSPSDVWAGGGGGAILHFDGTAWTRSETRTVETVRGFWLRDAGEMAWMSMFPVSTLVRGIDLQPSAGAQPSADGWLSAAGVATPDTLSKTLTAVWSTSDAEWLWGTTAISSMAFVTTEPNGLWRARIDAEGRTLAVSDALPSGYCGKLGCWQMAALHGATADDLWAVGRNGMTLHVTGAQTEVPTFTALDSQTWAMLFGVWATGSEMFAVGGAGTIRHYAGTGDTLDIIPDVPALETLHAVWGTSSNDVWAVGEAACVLHWDGAQWSRIAVRGLGGRRPDLYAVWTATPGKVWIGGDGVLLSLGGEP